MALAGMLSANREALICDMAETYGVFDFRALPVSLLATLAVGLRDNSRIKMHLSGAKITTNEALLAAAVDRLSTLLWFQSEDGRNGINRPKSVLKSLINADQQQGSVVSFDSGAAFEEEWAKITGVHHGR